MAELQINLPDAASAFVDAQVASGRFPTIHDYVGVEREEIVQWIS